jgi:hypothetical protein
MHYKQPRRRDLYKIAAAINNKDAPAEPSRCNDCGRSHGDPFFSWAPTFYDHVWLRLAREEELLCTFCLYERARVRGIKLKLADLLPCMTNLIPMPGSPFQFFANYATAPPENIEEWREAFRQIVPSMLL